MRPADLLACQLELVQKFDQHDFVDIIVGSMAGPYMPPEAFQRDETGLIRVSPKKREEWKRRAPQWIIDDAPRALQTWARYGMAVEVTSHMVDLINWVANEFEGTDAVDLDLAPSPYGFVHFEKPVKSIDVHGEELWTDWLVWGPVAQPGAARAVGAITFNDMYLDPDPQSRLAIMEGTTLPEVAESLKWVGRWAYSTFFTMYHEERMGPQEWPVDDLVKQIRQAGMDDESWQKRLTPTRNLSRFLYAIWTVMNQPIASLEQHHVDRATKRRMERMKIPPQVTVVTLRRPDNPHQHEGESGVQWQHHWIVRGHPRWQPYGPNRSERRLIWINPHFRGNLDAPLKQSDKVYVVKR